MSSSHSIVVRSGGDCVEYVYSDDLMGLLSGIGAATVRRASHVEPTVGTDGSVAWSADLSPIGGPVLGPYVSRAEALVSEIDWIESHYLGGE